MGIKIRVKMRADKMFYHKPVLLSEIIEFLQVKKGGRYIDSTLGGGGHTKEILKLGGEVLGIDLDEESIEYVKRRIKNKRLRIVQRNFREIDKIAISNGFEKVSGIIFDLGVSSHQIEDGSRGFSFQKEGPLDMRMGKNGSIRQVTAKDILNLAGKDELYEIFNKFGEEPRAWPLASAVVRARKIKAFETTSDLLKVIDEVYKIRESIPDKIRASISKRIFQALRIAVNSELKNLEEALPKAISLLEDGGRLAVISFHSLEDRIVKDSFLDFRKKTLGRIITEKPIESSEGEQEENPRSRSAKLRVFERLYA